VDNISYKTIIVQENGLLTNYEKKGEKNEK